MQHGNDDGLAAGNALRQKKWAEDGSRQVRPNLSSSGDSNVQAVLTRS